MFINPKESQKPELSQFKKMCHTAGNVFATTVFATGVTFAASATIYNTYVGKQEMKEVPTIISNTIEDNLKEQGFTGGIYDKMKGIQADGGACAPLAQDLRTDYNARVNGVFDKVYDTVSPKYVLEFGTSYDIYAKKNAKRYTDIQMSI